MKARKLVIALSMFKSDENRRRKGADSRKSTGSFCNHRQLMRSKRLKMSNLVGSEERSRLMPLEKLMDSNRNESTGWPIMRGTWRTRKKYVLTLTQRRTSVFNIGTGATLADLLKIAVAVQHAPSNAIKVITLSTLRRVISSVTVATQAGARA